MRVTGLLLRGEEVKSILDWVHCLGRLEVQIHLPTGMPTEEGLRPKGPDDDRGTSRKWTVRSRTSI